MTGFEEVRTKNFACTKAIFNNSVFAREAYLRVLRSHFIHRKIFFKLPMITERKVFTAIIEKPNDGMDTAYISIPFSVE